MTRIPRLFVLTGPLFGALALAFLAVPSPLRAQAFGERATLTIGAFGAGLPSNIPGELSPPDLYGAGGRVTIGLSALTGPTVHFLDYFTLGGFYFTYPEQGEGGATGVHFGAEIDLHFRRTPLAGVFDPFVSFSIGGLDVNAPGAISSHGSTISPGLGFRIPLQSRMELRLDGQYITVADSDTTAPANPGNDQYFQFAAGLQVGF